MLYRNILECILQFAKCIFFIFMKDDTVAGQAEMTIVIAIIYCQSIKFTVNS